MTARLAGTLIVALIIFSMGWTVASWKHGKTISDLEKDIETTKTEALKQARQAEQAAQKKKINADAKLEVKQGEANIVKREVIKEVIRYVQTPASKCQPGADWVRPINKARGKYLSDSP